MVTLGTTPLWKPEPTHKSFPRLSVLALTLSHSPAAVSAILPLASNYPSPTTPS